MNRKLITAVDARKEAQKLIAVFNEVDRDEDRLMNALEQLLNEEDFWVESFEATHRDVKQQGKLQEEYAYTEEKLLIDIEWLRKLIDSCIRSSKLSAALPNSHLAPKINRRHRKKI